MHVFLSHDPRKFKEMHWESLLLITSVAAISLDPWNPVASNIVDTEAFEVVRVAYIYSILKGMQMRILLISLV
jgi:hypothetical protein